MVTPQKLQRLPGTPDPNRLWHMPDGHVLAGDCRGDPKRQAVILLHGGGQTRHAWKGARDALVNAGYYTLALDARGHGDSSWAMNGDYQYTDMGNDLAYIVEQEALQKPVLIGASMGGMVSMFAQTKGLVDAGALVLVDIAPSINQEGTDRILAFMAQGREGFDSLEQVADTIASYQPQRKGKRSLDGLVKNVRRGEDGRYYWHWDPALFFGEKPRLDDFVTELRSGAATLDIPVLLVRGAMSDVLTEAGVEDFKKLCPHVQYANVAGAAHMVAGDRNDVFSDAILAFLQSDARVPRS